MLPSKNNNNKVKKRVKYLRSHCNTQVQKHDFLSEPMVQRMTLPSCFYLLESSPISAVLSISTLPTRKS